MYVPEIEKSAITYNVAASKAAKNCNSIRGQGLIQKEKVHIDCEKVAQISILANKIASKWWPNITIKEFKLTITFIFYFLDFLDYAPDLIKKLELNLVIVSVLLKIWARPNYCAQNWYPGVKNSLDQPLWVDLLHVITVNQDSLIYEFTKYCQKQADLLITHTFTVLSLDILNNLLSSSTINK